MLRGGIVDTGTKDFIIPLLAVMLICLSCLVFAGYIVERRENTIQTCIQHDRVWIKNDCLVAD